MRLIFAALTLVTSTVFAQVTPLPPGAAPIESITVSGTGRVALRPDRFSFTVGVQTLSPSLEDAVNENNQRVAAVIAALKKAGATDSEIRTSGFSLSPQQDYQQGKLPRIVGYAVSNNVTVTKNVVADAGRLLQVAVNAGVNSASNIELRNSDPSRGRDEGLRAAFQDARAKATLLATAAGRTLGRAMMINEGSEPAPPRPYPMQAMMKSAAADVSEVPVEGGTQESSFTITVVFELR
ncbi:MAG: uncharacterized protein QOI24_1835 [Acidobacteriota bacterium]|jgi:uncharacterized protein YggE|nr:uncharacterized protein [Acidobacteriota bacterium]